MQILWKINVSSNKNPENMFEKPGDDISSLE